jgi:hypothetical protein
VIVWHRVFIRPGQQPLAIDVLEASPLIEEIYAPRRIGVSVIRGKRKFGDQPRALSKTQQPRGSQQKIDPQRHLAALAAEL